MKHQQAIGTTVLLRKEKSRMKIIGFTGKMQHGKTTAGEAASELFNRFLVSRRPFAESLKEAATNLGWNGKKDEKGRRLLQLLGTELCRECIDYDYWVKRWKEKVDQDISNGKEVIIVDDIRFDNEAEAVKEMGGIVIEVIRPEPRSLFKIPNPFTLFFNTTHASESGVDAKYIDTFIINDLPLEDYRLQVKEIINEWLI